MCFGYHDNTSMVVGVTVTERIKVLRLVSSDTLWTTFPVDLNWFAILLIDLKYCQTPDYTLHRCYCAVYKAEKIKHNSYVKWFKVTSINLSIISDLISLHYYNNHIDNVFLSEGLSFFKG